MTSPPDSPHRRDGGELARLLQTEARLDAVLRGAREEAGRLVTAARDRAQAEQAGLAGELEADGRELAQAITEERRRREVELTDAARREVERLERVTPQEIEGLAQYVLGRVIGTPP